MNRREIIFGGHAIGDGHRTFVTFEAGPTINGVQSALDLVRLARESGGDAIKFQFVDPDMLVPDRSITLTYLVLNPDGSTEAVEEPVYDILSRRVLTNREWKDVKALADKLGIAFFATAEFEKHIDLICDLQCDSIKIASTDIDHLPLIRHAAKTDLIIQLDTGNSTIGEVERAVDAVLETGNDKIIIHNVPSGYPSQPESINLNLIKTLRTTFPTFPIAYSDHMPGWNMDIAAIAVGANLVEKTLTLDRHIRSPEHIMSVDAESAGQFIQVIRETDVAMGGHRRTMGPQELTARMIRRRGAYLKCNTYGQQVLFPQHIEWRRPEIDGIVTPDMAEDVWGKLLRESKRKGEPLMKRDIE